MIHVDANYVSDILAIVYQQSNEDASVLPRKEMKTICV